MYLPILKEPQHITQTTGSETREGLYWEEYLGKKDKYSTFLGGNHSVDVIRNSDVKSERKLMILKDSYANSMIPFLATNFSEIHVVDLRYYAQNLYTYIDENGTSPPSTASSSSATPMSPAACWRPNRAAQPDGRP